MLRTAGAFDYSSQMMPKLLFCFFPLSSGFGLFLFYQSLWYHHDCSDCSDILDIRNVYM